MITEEQKKTANIFVLFTFIGFVYNWIFRKHEINPARMRVGERKQLMPGDKILSGPGIEYTIDIDSNGIKWLERTK